MAGKSPGWRYLSIAALSLLWGFLRLRGLAGESLWLDEAYTSYWAHQPLWDILRVPECDAKLFTIILKTFIAIFGNSDFVVRLPSLLADLGAATVIWQLGQKLKGERLAALLTLSYLLHPTILYWARVGRPYTLLLLLSSLLLLQLLAWCREAKPRQLPWIGLTAGTMLFCQKSAYFLLPVLVLLFLPGSRLLAKPKLIFKLAIPLLALLLPIGFLEVATWGLSSQTLKYVAALNPFANSWWLPFQALPRLTPLLAAPPQYWVSGGAADWGVPLSLLTFFASVAILYWYGKRQKWLHDQSLVLLGWWLIPLTTMMLLGNAGFSVYLPARNDLYVVLALLLAPLYATTLLPRRYALALQSLFFTTFVPFHFMHTVPNQISWQRQYDRQNASWLASQMTPADQCLLVDFTYFTHSRYLPAAEKQRCQPYRATLNPYAAKVDVDALLNQQVVKGKRFWVVAPLVSTHHEYFEELVAKVNDLARQRQLKFTTQRVERNFDWQGAVAIFTVEFAPAP